MSFYPIIAGPPGDPLTNLMLTIYVVGGTVLAVTAIGIAIAWRLRQTEHNPPRDDRGRR